MIVTGQHRNLALAERHAAALRRKHGQQVEIISRTNADGEQSARGHFFEFKILEKKKKKKRDLPATEFVLHFDYGEEDGDNLIRFQIHLIAPKGRKVSDEKAMRAIEEWNETGEPPKGFKVKSIYYGHPQFEEETQRAMREELESLKSSAIHSGNARISGRYPIRKNRRSGKKAKKQ